MAEKDKCQIKENLGFTLIEVIVTLVLVGILAATAGMGIVSSVTGYLMAQENATVSQKAELTLRRITLELREAESIYSCNSDDSDYVVIDGKNEGHDYIYIKLVGNEIKMLSGTTPPNESTGDVLVSGVNSFSLDFYRYNDTDTPTWVPADGFDELGIIFMQLILNRTDGETQAFKTSVHPGDPAT
jgi:prepilin-type N-terminal cleavage/methylation domain-containing protein